MPRFAQNENVRACITSLLGAKATRKPIWAMRTGPSTIEVGFDGDERGTTITRPIAREHNTTPAEIMRVLRRAGKKASAA